MLAKTKHTAADNSASTYCCAHNYCYAFTGGGTGGHIFPGLAVVDALRAMGGREQGAVPYIVWLGSSRGMDKNLVEKSGKVDRFYGIPSGKLRRYFSLRTIIDAVRIIAGFFAALFLFIKLKPAFLF